MPCRRLSLSVWGLLPPAVALALGLLTTVTLFLSMHRYEQDHEDFNFERRAHAHVLAIQAGLDSAVQALDVVNQSFTIFGPVSREQFRMFTKPLLASYPYIQNFSFHRLVPGPERAAYEAKMRKAYPGFAISDMVGASPRPAPARESYRVVDYLEPVAGTEVLFGIDASTMAPGHEPAMRHASATGRATATGLYPLHHTPDLVPGFALLKPVYRPVTSADGSQAPAVVGYTVAVVRAKDFVETVLAGGSLLNVAADVSIYAAPSADEQHLAYHRQTPPPARALFPLTGWMDDRPRMFTQTFDAGGASWHMVISDPRIPFATHHIGSLLTLLVGFVCSCMAAGYIHALLQRARRSRDLLHERATELRQTNERLVADIAARKQVETALWKSQKSLRELAVHQQQVKENERKRIARELHDELGQNLLALRLDVSMLHARTQKHPNLNAMVASALVQLDATMKAVKEIINDLRPTVLDLGLHAALEWQVKQFERRSGIACELRIDHDEFRLDDARSTALFRIVQESLTNAGRHAKASRVRVMLSRKAGRLWLTIADNGIGISPECRGKANSFGLAGIQERIHALAGTFAIAGEQGQGTVLTVSVPLEESAEGQMHLWA